MTLEEMSNMELLTSFRAAIESFNTSGRKADYHYMLDVQEEIFCRMEEN